MDNDLDSQGGIFGLGTTKTFFVVLLGLAVLAYAIVAISGVLTTTDIIPAQGGVVYNETLSNVINSPTNLAAISQVTVLPNTCLISSCFNAANQSLTSSNYSVYNCEVTYIP